MKNNHSPPQLLHFIRFILKPFRPFLYALILINAIWAFDVSIKPYCLKLLLDNLASNSLLNIIYPATAFLLITLLGTITYRFYDYTYLKFYPNLTKHIILHLSNHVIHHSHSFFQNNFPGAITNKINDVAEGIKDITQTVLDKFFSHLLVFILSGITITTVHWSLALITVLWSLFFVWLGLRTSPALHSFSHKVSESRSSITGSLVDILSNSLLVRLFNRQPHEQNLLAQNLSHYVHKDQLLQWLILRLHAIQSISYLLLMALTLAILIYNYSKGIVSVGDFALSITLIGTIIEYSWMLSKDFSQFTESLGKVSQGLEITLSPHQISSPLDAPPLSISSGSIEFQNVQFYFQSQAPLFSNKSVFIPGGQKVGLVGHSGSGKTTFVNLILRLFDVQQGKILIDNQNIKKISLFSLYQNIGIIPQDPSLFFRSIYDNIAYGNPSASQDQIIQAAINAHAHDFISNLPDGYQTSVGERGLKLSGGQRQRIAIARVFLKNPPILILDEATSALDSHTESLIQQSLHNLMANKTTIVIAHRLSTLLSMDRILVFHQGSIIEDGSHNQLLSLNGSYANLWHNQSGGFIQDPPHSPDEEE